MATLKQVAVHDDPLGRPKGADVADGLPGKHEDDRRRPFARRMALRNAQADARIATHLQHREAAKTRRKLEQVANSTTRILSLLRCYQSLSQVQSAASKLEATIGLEPQLGNPNALSLTALTQTVATLMPDWTNALRPVDQPDAALGPASIGASTN